MTDAVTFIRICGLCKLRPRLLIASRSLCLECKAAALETKRVGNIERNRVAYAAKRRPALPKAAHPISLAAVATRPLRIRGADRFLASILYRGHAVPLLDDPVAGGEADALREVERLAAGSASFGEFVEARYQRHRHGFATPLNPHTEEA